MSNEEILSEIREAIKGEKLSRSLENDERTELFSKFLETRHVELREECLNRGLYASDTDTDSDSDSDNNNSEDNSNKDVWEEGEDNKNNKCEDSSSTNKRKFEEDENSSTQPSKSFKQDSSDVTGDTEPYDICGGEDC
uniref:Uncharacterized protein n=1 Tax=Chrysoporthe deuterocubensis TaxID=764597 RepID=A0A191MX91_9PEZI|nr:hypothetical protein [Chrysoporthe deuterocubensis]AMX22173.1 hypothetical protein [Chrysoporthe deuterocubensis]